MTSASGVSRTLLLVAAPPRMDELEARLRRAAPAAAVLIAATDAEALAILRGGRVDCLLVDLPGKDDALAVWTSGVPDAACAVVVLTASDAGEIAERCFRAGVHEVIGLDDLESGALSPTIERAMARRSATRRDSTTIAAFAQEQERQALADIAPDLLSQLDREQLLLAERAARTALEREARVRDEFLSTLSHELRTPLNAIVGWVALLRRSSHDSSLLAHGLEVIGRNAEAQVLLVDELLDVNRMMSGKLRLTVTPIDVNEPICAAAETVQPAADVRGLTVALELARDLPMVNADAHRLQQVVWNLLINAVKFTPQGGHVRVRTRRDADDVVLSVRDTGEGLSSDFLPFLFERFRQADGTTGRRHEGLGLGLSISRQIVEMHGGSITARSEGPGLGSEFVVRLPAALAPEVSRADEGQAPRPRIIESASPPEDGRPLTGCAVLVVDDHADALDLCRRVLSGAGATVHTAAAARDAIALIAAQRPDALVSDIGMPEMDGFALIRHLRTTCDLPPALLPALAISAFSRAEDRARALAAGYQEFLVKPLHPHALVAAVCALVGDDPSRSPHRR